MGLLMRTALLAGASALLVATMAPLAGADTVKGEPGIWQDSGGRVSSSSRGGSSNDGRGRRGPKGEKGPVDENPVAPVPEPGTMALVSLGVMALAAGARKRRARQAPVQETSL